MLHPETFKCWQRYGEGPKEAHTQPSVAIYNIQDHQDTSEDQGRSRWFTQIEYYLFQMYTNDNEVISDGNGIP